jgi:7-keto-8-aminopelargonate synthetase-like enzyme
MAEAPHRFRNNAVAVPLGNRGWDEAMAHGLLGIRADFQGRDRYQDSAGHRFINLCSCSYLGLNHHPALRAGAIAALQREQAITMPISRVRVQINLLDELEAGLASLYQARSVTAISCAAASAGVLPLVASGHLAADGEPRVMVFDRFCHFSMNLIKPVCADETTVLTAPHNDLDFIEDVCRRHRRVAFVGDGAYSMGGAADVAGLLALQDRYGLFLYLDDSHALSVIGERGEGLVRSRIAGELNPLTIIVGSLAKAFGASGGVIMLGCRHHEAVLSRFGGPLAWSQGPNVAAMGAGLAAVAIHLSPELRELQERLARNIQLVDARLATAGRHSPFTIRLIPLEEEARAAELAGRLLARGFYTSAVFFPIVEKGKAALRIMVRADNQPEDLERFCAAVAEELERPAEAAATGRRQPLAAAVPA